MSSLLNIRNFKAPITSLMGMQQTRTIKVKVGSSAYAAYTQMSNRLKHSGAESVIKEARQRYLRPSLKRQLKEKADVYFRAQKERNSILEELALDPKNCPF